MFKCSMWKCQFCMYYVLNTRNQCPRCNSFKPIPPVRISVPHIVSNIPSVTLGTVNSNTIVSGMSNMDRGLIFENKVKFNYKMGDCPICLCENVKIIPVDCHAHFICPDCYKLINIPGGKCPICRMVIN